LAGGEVDDAAAAAGAVALGRHAQHLVGLGVAAAVGVIAGGVDGGGDRAAGAQRAAQALGPPRCGVGARRQAGDALEQAVQVMAAEAGALGQFVQAGRLFEGVEPAAQLGDQRRLAFGQRRQVGVAALAGAEAGAFGLGAAGVEGDVVRPRRARGAGRPAIDAGAAHRVEERAVGSRVAGQHGGPARIVASGCCPLLFVVVHMLALICIRCLQCRPRAPAKRSVACF